MKKLTIKEAESLGFTVDTHCYPHIGYKGERFNFDNEKVIVYTKLEEKLLTHIMKLSEKLVKANELPVDCNNSNCENFSEKHKNNCAKDLKHFACRYYEIRVNKQKK